MFFTRKKPNLPVLSKVNGLLAYRWPDGSLFYTQGDGFTCPRGHNSPRLTCRCGQVVRT